MPTERLVDLTGAGDAERRDVDETGEEVPGPGDYEDDEDDLDQQNMTEHFRSEYESAGGSIPISTLVDNHYSVLLKLKPDELSFFRADGKLKEIEALVNKIEVWSTLHDGGSRYRRFETDLFTEENLDFLQNALDIVEGMRARAFEEDEEEDEEEPKLKQEPVDEGEIKDNARKFYGVNKRYVQLTRGVIGNTPAFIREMTQRYGQIIEDITSMELKGVPGAQEVYQEYLTLIQGYQGAVRKADEYDKLERITHDDQNAKKRLGIVKQLWSWDKEKKYLDVNDKPHYERLIRGFERLRVRVQQIGRARFPHMSLFKKPPPFDEPKIGDEPPKQKKIKVKLKPQLGRELPDGKPQINWSAEDIYDSVGRKQFNIQELLRQRFAFVFNEVQWTDRKYFKGREREFDEMTKVHHRYDMKIKGGPQKSGRQVSVYNWLADIDNADERRVQALLGTREQFELMFQVLGDFEQDWKKESGNLNIDWSVVRGQGPSVATGTGAGKDPPWGGPSADARALVSEKVRTDSGFQKDLVGFLWSEKNAKALLSGDAQAKETMLHDFFKLWKTYFPGLKAVPADWPRQSAQMLRDNKLTSYLEDNLFFGKLRDITRSTKRTQKALADDDVSKVYSGRQARSALLEFVRLIQDRDRYSKWEQKFYAGGKAIKRIGAKTKPKQDLRTQVKAVGIKWIYDHRDSDLKKMGPVGVKMSRVTSAIAKAESMAKAGYPHYSIVEEVADYLGLGAASAEENGKSLLCNMLEDKGDGTGAPPHPWRWDNVVQTFGQTEAEKWAKALYRRFEKDVSIHVAKDLGERLPAGKFPNSGDEDSHVRAFSKNEFFIYQAAKIRATKAEGDEEKDPPKPKPAPKPQEEPAKDDVKEPDKKPEPKDDVKESDEKQREQDRLLQEARDNAEKINDRLRREARDMAQKVEQEQKEKRLRELARLAQEHSMATAARRKNQSMSSDVEEHMRHIKIFQRKIDSPINAREHRNRETYQKKLKHHREEVRRLQKESSPIPKKPVKKADIDDTSSSSPLTPPKSLPSLPRSPSPSPDPPERRQPPSPALRRLKQNIANSTRHLQRMEGDLARDGGRLTDFNRSALQRKIATERTLLTRLKGELPAPSLSGAQPRRRRDPKRPASKPEGVVGVRPPPRARPSHAKQVTFRVGGVQRTSASQRRQPMPPVRQRARPPVHAAPPQNMQQVAPPQIYAGPAALSQAAQDLVDRNIALAALRNHPRFRPDFEKNFEYDQNSKSYKEKRRAYYSYAPIHAPYMGAYQLQAVHQQEVAYVRAKHPDLETFKRNDVYDTARKFNRDARKRPLDGRARQYLNVGPWLRLRLLKTSVHITRKGTPPPRAYTILAKHLLKQIEKAVKPRIVAPNFKGSKKNFLTLGTTEALVNATQSELAHLLEKGLRRKPKHIIYRQTNIGGPLMDYAKKNEALY